MLNGLLLSVSMAACLVTVTLRKMSAAAFEDKGTMFHVYTACESFACMIMLAVLSGNHSVSLFTLVLGVAFGAVTALGTFFTLSALHSGPLAYTTVITSLSTIVPTLSGSLFWGESIAWIQMLGVGLMLVCFVLSVDFSGERKAASWRWFSCTMLAFACTGMIGVMQKWHQNTTFKDERDGFLVVAFAVSALCSLCAVLVRGRTIRATIKKGVTLRLVVYILAAGICAAANNKINLFLSGTMDSAVFFPVVNGGGLILTTLTAFVIFKEKPSVKKWIGIGIGILAVLLLCNPF